MSETQESNGTQTGTEGESPQSQAGDPKQRTPEESESFRRFRANINPVERFLLFLSKTELFALQFCTTATRMTQASIGAMVLITGVFAFVSSYLFVSSCFFRGTSAVIPLFALLCSVAVITAYREVVSFTNTSFGIGVLIRIIYATLIGIAISTPLELKLQEGRINAEIEKHVQSRNKPKAEKIIELKKQRDKLIEDIVRPYFDVYRIADSDYQFRMGELKKEADRVMYGPIAKQRDADMEKSSQKRDDARKEFEKNRLKILHDVEDEKKYPISKEINDLAREIENDSNRSHDFLSQLAALSSIKKYADSTAYWVGLFITLLFVAFELAPILLKISMPSQDYNTRADTNNSK